MKNEGSITLRGNKLRVHETTSQQKTVLKFTDTKK